MVGISSTVQSTLIDALVATSQDVAAPWAGDGTYPNVPQNEDTNTLLASRSSEQRAIIARMIQDAKVAGIHDALVVLLDDGGYRVSQDGAESPYRPCGTESHFDYLARFTGRKWPEAD
jgi:hypothetical protein